MLTYFQDELQDETQVGYSEGSVLKKSVTFSPSILERLNDTKSWYCLNTLGHYGRWDRFKTWWKPKYCTVRVQSELLRSSPCCFFQTNGWKPRNHRRLWTQTLSLNQTQHRSNILESFSSVSTTKEIPRAGWVLSQCLCPPNESTALTHGCWAWAD